MSTIPGKRGKAGEILLSEDRVWILGGVHGDISTYVCSPSTGCQAYVDLPGWPSQPRVVRVDERRIFVLPNGYVSGNVSKSYIFDQVDETWSLLPDMPYPMFYTTVGLVNGHDVVVVGGRNRESYIFDLNTNLWRQGPDLPSGRKMGAGVQYQNSFFFVGGKNGHSQKTDTIFWLNPDDYKFETLPQRLPLPLVDAAAFLIPDDFIACS